MTSEDKKEKSLVDIFSLEEIFLFYRKNYSSKNQPVDQAYLKQCSLVYWRYKTNKNIIESENIFREKDKMYEFPFNSVLSSKDFVFFQTIFPKLTVPKDFPMKVSEKLNQFNISNDFKKREFILVEIIKEKLLSDKQTLMLFLDLFKNFLIPETFLQEYLLSFLISSDITYYINEINLLLNFLKVKCRFDFEKNFIIILNEKIDGCFLKIEEKWWKLSDSLNFEKKDFSLCFFSTNNKIVDKLISKQYPFESVLKKNCFKILDLFLTESSNPETFRIFIEKNIALNYSLWFFLLIEVDISKIKNAVRKLDLKNLIDSQIVLNEENFEFACNVLDFISFFDFLPKFQEKRELFEMFILKKIVRYLMEKYVEPKNDYVNDPKIKFLFFYFELKKICNNFSDFIGSDTSLYSKKYIINFLSSSKKWLKAITQHSYYNIKYQENYNLRTIIQFEKQILIKIVTTKKKLLTLNLFEWEGLISYLIIKFYIWNKDIKNDVRLRQKVKNLLFNDHKILDIIDNLNNNEVQFWQKSNRCPHCQIPFENKLDFIKHWTICHLNTFEDIQKAKNSESIEKYQNSFLESIVNETNAPDPRVIDSKLDEANVKMLYDETYLNSFIPNLVFNSYLNNFLKFIKLSDQALKNCIDISVYIKQFENFYSELNLNLLNAENKIHHIFFKSADKTDKLIIIFSNEILKNNFDFKFLDNIISIFNDGFLLLDYNNDYNQFLESLKSYHLDFLEQHFIVFNSLLILKNPIQLYCSLQVQDLDEQNLKKFQIDSELKMNQFIINTFFKVVGGQKALIWYQIFAFLNRTCPYCGEDLKMEDISNESFFHLLLSSNSKSCFRKLLLATFSEFI